MNASLMDAGRADLADRVGPGEAWGCGPRATTTILDCDDRTREQKVADRAKEAQARNVHPMFFKV